MVEPDVARAKVAAIERHLARIREVRAGRPGLLPVDREELTVLNLLAAIQTCIDLAVHVVSSEGYGLPGTQAEAFTLLEKNGLIDAGLAAELRRMAGFRNVVVHRYAEIDSAAVERIVRDHLDDLRSFATLVVAAFDL